MQNISKLFAKYYEDSISGLAFAVKRKITDIFGLVEEQGGLYAQDRADLCAGFQAAIADVLAAKTRRALRVALDEGAALSALCVAGGVAANNTIRALLETVSVEYDLPFVAPPLALCTDNAAMIAYAALERMESHPPDDLSLAARPRWPLDQTSPALLGSGKKGAKA